MKKITLLMLILLCSKLMFAQIVATISPDAVPVGTVIIWAGPVSTIPNGWLQCNGDQIYDTRYPKLCGILQDYWSPAGQYGKRFLPDLRGLVLRGVSGSRADDYADPDKQNRTPSDKHTSNDVGSTQMDAFQGHWHGYIDDGVAHLAAIGQFGSGFQVSNVYNDEKKVRDDRLGASNPKEDNQNHGTPKTSSETRMKNAYVYYIIKAE